jgi:hypothetical protein
MNSNYRLLKVLVSLFFIGATALRHIAPKYRERFSKGYRFWRGTQWSALKVIGLSDKEGVLRVKTQIVSPSGCKDNEIKRLLFSRDKGFLLES